MNRSVYRIILIMFICASTKHVYSQKADSVKTILMLNNYSQKIVTARTYLYNSPLIQNNFSTLNHLYYYNYNQAFIPKFTEGKFCNFEDNINRNRKLRVDFGTD